MEYLLACRNIVEVVHNTNKYSRSAKKVYRIVICRSIPTIPGSLRAPSFMCLFAIGFHPRRLLTGTGTIALTLERKDVVVGSPLLLPPYSHGRSLSLCWLIGKHTFMLHKHFLISLLFQAVKIIFAICPLEAWQIVFLQGDHFIENKAYWNTN